jgi:hypothetical protein
MAENIDFKSMMELIKMKKEKPEEYKQFLADFGGVAMDVTTILAKISVKLGKEIDAGFK